MNFEVADGGVPITPSDTLSIEDQIAAYLWPTESRRFPLSQTIGFFVAGAGTLVCAHPMGGADVTWTVPANTNFKVRAKYIRAASTATGIKAYVAGF